MVITVKACKEGEPVMVLDDGRIILGEAGHVALIIHDDARGETGTVMLDLSQAWELASALIRERRIAAGILRAATTGRVKLYSILGGKK